MIDFLYTTITTIFFIVVASYYVLLFLKIKKPDYHKKFHSITVIIPAHNEERYIAACIQSVQDAAFDGPKQILVVDDASRDATPQILKTIKGITVMTNRHHTGKSASMNKALQRATGDLVAIVDGDSTIQQDALVELARELTRERVAAAAAVVRVQNRKAFLCVSYYLEDSLVSYSWFILLI